MNNRNKFNYKYVIAISVIILFLQTKIINSQFKNVIMNIISHSN